MADRRIALIVDFDPHVTAHAAIEQCFKLIREKKELPMEPVWFPTERITPTTALEQEGFTGVWCVPASPYRRTEGALQAIQFARENNIPFLGTCGGFQHALLEYARNVLGLKEAAHAEIDPKAPLPFVTRLRCSLVEAAQLIVVTEPGPFRDAYGADSGVEGFCCSYGLNPKFEHLFKEGPMQI